MIYWIWLSLALGAGSRKLKPLLERFGGAREIYAACASALETCGTLSAGELKRLKNKDLSACEEVAEVCNNSGIRMVSYEGGLFPERLRQIADPPACLYYKGELPDIDREPMICMVGPRKASEYGRLAAWSLAGRLTAGGMTVVSGGALGIDSAALNGALDAGGKVVSVLACGINYPYLSANAALRERIASNGCLISEYPPQEKAYRQNFLVRNRLMSALALGTVVVEAPVSSGSLNTAHHASEQGRDVFVITGRPDDPNCAGSNALLRDGAAPVFDADDIFFEYMGLFPDRIDPEKAKTTNLSKIFRRKLEEKSTPASAFRRQTDQEKQKTAKPETVQKFSKKNIAEGLSKNAEIVYNFIDSDYFTMDDLTACGLPVPDILVSLTELELRNIIQAVPGGRYTILLN